jgi:hypothetical protein
MDAAAVAWGGVIAANRTGDLGIGCGSPSSARPTMSTSTTTSADCFIGVKERGLVVPGFEKRRKQAEDQGSAWGGP